MDDPRRSIPSVDRLLASASFAPLLEGVSRTRVLSALQAVQQQVRQAIAAGDRAGSPHEPVEAWYASAVQQELTVAERASLRPLINATGVVLHTNLGRAPLAQEAVDAVARAASGYTNLEYDLARGERGSRYVHCARLLCELTGAEDALVVNNNAGALVLALNTMADGRVVVVSRGELVEIGGEFRVPEIMARSGARLREVGATNRTRVADYERALDADVAALLKVHRSNFRMSGFVAEVDAAALAAVAHAAGRPMLHDLGSGLMVEGDLLGLPGEPTVRSTLGAGADVVGISADKLLGGPQAGILLGRATWIERMRRNPLCRALRVDKLTLAALEATLALYRDPALALARIPVLRMITAAPAVLRARAESLARALAAAGIHADVVEADGMVGGGACPEARLPGYAVALKGESGADAFAARLRAGTPAIVGRVRDDRLLLDLRTVDPAADVEVGDAVRAAAR